MASEVRLSLATVASYFTRAANVMSGEYWCSTPNVYFLNLFVACRDLRRGGVKGHEWGGEARRGEAREGTERKGREGDAIRGCDVRECGGRATRGSERREEAGVQTGSCGGAHMEASAPRE